MENNNILSVLRAEDKNSITKKRTIPPPYFSLGNAPDAMGRANRARRERSSHLLSVFGLRRPAGSASSPSVSGFLSRLPRAAARLVLAMLLLAGGGVVATPAFANTAPTASDGEVTTKEDTEYTFQASDFSFADTDSSDTLDSVKVVTIPGAGKGTLELDGTAIASGDLPETVGAGDLGTDKGLVYVPPADANGDNYTTFDFRVNDGTADSADDYTMTIDVDSVPDVRQVAVTSTPRSGTTPKKYGAGENIQVTVTFDEAVTVTGDPVVNVEVGGNSRPATYARGSGSMALVFEYTVIAEDTDSDGISINANALTLDSNDKIEGSDNDGADKTHAALAAQSNHKVDGSLAAPGAPTGLIVVAGNAMVKLAWTAPEEAGTSPVTGYEYQRKEGGGSYGVWTATDHDLGVHQTVTGLNNNTAYTFRVRAVNAVGAGQESAEASATPNTDFRPVIAGDSTAEQATTFRITITFDRDVPELRRKALVVRGGKLVEEAKPAPPRMSRPAGREWTAHVSPDYGFTGWLTIDIPAGAVRDGGGNVNMAAVQYRRLIKADHVRPRLFMNLAPDTDTGAYRDPAEPVSGPITVRLNFASGFIFHQPVTGLELDDIVITNGTKTNLVQAEDVWWAGDYEVTVTPDPTYTGPFTVTVEEGAAYACHDLELTRCDETNLSLGDTLALHVVASVPRSPLNSEMEGDSKKPDGNRRFSLGRSVESGNKRFSLGRSVESGGERGCAVEVSVAFLDEDGNAVAVDALAAADFTVENGRVGTPVADADGLGWTVPGWATPGFRGLMRVRLAATERWEAAEQVFRVKRNTSCAPAARNALASLGLDGLDLDPSFDAETAAYTAAVPSDKDMVTVSAAAVYGAAAVAIAPADADEETDGHQVALPVGETAIEVTVTPGDGSAAQTYTVTVTRAAADPDGTRSGAVSLGAQSPAKGRQFFRDKSLDRANGDNVDYYTFTTDGRYELGLGARDQSVELKVTIEDADGNTVGTAGPPKDPKKDQLYIEWLQQTIETGTYYIRVEALADGATDYYLRFGLKDAAADPDGTRSGAVSLGAQSPDRGRQFFRDKSLDRAAGDAVDYYTFTTDGRYQLGLGVRDQSVEVKVVLEDANGATTGTAGPPLDPNKDQVYIEWLKQVIAPGTYYVRVEALEDGATDYYIRFGLTDPPPALSVADAQAEEGTDATLDFAVTLDRSSTGTVTVEYATADGTATVAGNDYTATSGTLTFAPGEREKTVSVSVLDDNHDEGSEALTLRLSNPSGAYIEDGEATGTITNSDPIPQAWLARFGRTVTGQVLDAVEERLKGLRRAEAEASLAGQALPSWRAADSAEADVAAAVAELWAGTAPFESTTSWLAVAGVDDAGTEPQLLGLTERDLVAGTSFALTGGGVDESGPGYASFWGRGSIAGFDGREGNLALDGEVTTGLIGADWATGNWIAGLAVGHSTGTGAYRGTDGSGGIDASLTGLYPYAGVELGSRLSVWTAAGWGSGEVTVTPEGSPRMKADLSMSMGAVGLRGEVLRPGAGGGLALAVKGDARFTRTSSDAVRSASGNLEASDADVWLVRAGVEGSRHFTLGPPDGGVLVTPSFEAGLRLDGGDAESGMGTDMGGGLSFADPAHGLSFDLRGRALVAHEASGFREWGASVSASWDPRPGTNRGLSALLRQDWGTSPSGGMDALLSRETLAGLVPERDGAGFRASSRLEGELGYGLGTFGGAFTGTPNLGFRLSETARDYRVGWRLIGEREDSTGFEVSLDATRREPSSNDDAPPEQEVTLKGAIRW